MLKLSGGFLQKLHGQFCCHDFGNFMAILDIQIVASSLNEVQAGMSASRYEVTWVQTVYLIAEIIAIPMSSIVRECFQHGCITPCVQSALR